MVLLKYLKILLNTDRR